MMARMKAPKDDAVAIAVLETKVDQLMEDGLRREEHITAMRAEVGEMKDAVNEFKAEITKYRGFMGGAVFVITGMGVIVMKFIGPIWDWITKVKTGG